MLFNSFEFLLVFLPVTLILFFVIGNKQKHKIAVAWLVTASLFFYSWWNPAYLGLLLFSMLFNYCFGIILGSRKKSKVLLTIGITANLITLAYF